jgi:tetratricopeptide (TPR) repeat protein
MKQPSGRVRRLLPLATLLLLVGLAVGGWGAWQGRADDLLRRGEQALAGRDYDAARDHLTRYLEARPDDARARLLAARAARRLRRFDEAGADLTRCRQYGRDAYRLYRALDGLNFYLDRRPDDLAALLSRGFVWERLLSFADAAEDYRRAVAAHPDSEAARLKLGEALLVSATPAEALEQFQWLHERRPDHGPTRLGLARCRRRLGQTDEARRLLDVLAADHPGRGEVLWERGQMELEDGRPAEAELWLRKALAASPHDRRVAFSLARCLARLGRPDAAEVQARAEQLDKDLHRLDTVRTRVLVRPTDAAAWCEGGLLFLRNGEREEGLRWLRRAVQLDPGCDAARQALAGSAGPRPGP